MAKKNLVFAHNPLLAGPALDERNRSGIPYREVKTALIERDPNQPRVIFDEAKLRELAESIKLYGVLNPLIVKPGREAGKYQLVAGERRLRACGIAGVDTVPVIVNTETDSTGDTTLAMQLVENLQRDDLSPLERAHAIGALKETYDLSIRQVAEKLGVSKSMVQRSLDILELPDDLMNALRQGASESKVLLLSKIEDEDIRTSYLKDLDTLTRSQIKNEIDKELSEKKAPKARALSAEDGRLVEELRNALGLKVGMVRSGSDPEAGKLLIEFYSEGDLQELFRKLVNEG
ncbi:MAG: ParB/RepB/Spo0J family partition protein [Bdellovibrionales bacterium]|nr:ParB/RepB/Spo0J family partition protein [Bdellovibrionales bacterium]